MNFWNSFTSTGIEPSTFLLVAYCLNRHVTACLHFDPCSVSNRRIYGLIPKTVCLVSPYLVLCWNRLLANMLSHVSSCQNCNVTCDCITSWGPYPSCNLTLFSMSHDRDTRNSWHVIWETPWPDKAMSSRHLTFFFQHCPWQVELHVQSA
jgi:hypothetical protein